MAGFYNPYMKTPDYGQGIADFKNKAAQILMLLFSGGMLGGGAAAPTLGQTPMPAPRPMGGLQMFGNQAASGMGFGQGQAGSVMPGQTATGVGMGSGMGSGMGGQDWKITPEMIQRILALLNAGGGQFGGGGQRF